MSNKNEEATWPYNIGRSVMWLSLAIMVFAMAKCEAVRITEEEITTRSAAK